MGVSTVRVPQLLALYQEYLDHPEFRHFCGQSGAVLRRARWSGWPSTSGSELRRAAVLALGFLGDYENNAVLGSALQDKDRTVRILAENSIRQVWTRAGDEADRSRLGAIMRLNAARQFEKVHPPGRAS